MPSDSCVVCAMVCWSEFSRVTELRERIYTKVGLITLVCLVQQLLSHTREPKNSVAVQGPEIARLLPSEIGHVLNILETWRQWLETTTLLCLPSQ